MEQILKILLLFLIPVSAHSDIVVFNGNPVDIVWSEYGEEYEYMVEIYQYKSEEEILFYTSDWMLESSIQVEIEEEGSYIWRVYIKEIGKVCSDDHQCFNIETGYFDFYFPPSIPEKPPLIPDEEIGEKVVDLNPPVGEILGATTEYIAKEEFKPKKEDKEESMDVEKRSGANECTYSYIMSKKKYILDGCNIALPSISESTYSKYNDQYVVSSKGKYQNTLTIHINDIVCSKFDLLHPSTWFGCEENVVNRHECMVDLDHEVYFFNKGVVSPTNFVFNRETFEISKVLSNLPTALVFKGYFSLRHSGEWLDQELVFKKKTSFTEIEAPTSGIYSFPFKRLIPVNQWHGCTRYQCPHAGIDFASGKEKIYASGDGVVVSAKQSTPYSECGNSGKAIVLELDTGQYMSYMHLSNIRVRSGDIVKRGDLLAVSGNTGTFNCQPLGYHLHFELREGRWQASHIDPVPYIDIDWNLIHTNKKDIFPGRLSGDNPHPSF
ncbi:M23 family metallopeptidase [bacterium]|nr:M23 family metallopeptidase [bacterium]